LRLDGFHALTRRSGWTSRSQFTGSVPPPPVTQAETPLRVSGTSSYRLPLESPVASDSLLSGSVRQSHPTGPPRPSTPGARPMSNPDDTQPHPPEASPPYQPLYPPAPPVPAAAAPPPPPPPLA